MKIIKLKTEEVETIPRELQDGVIYVSRKFGTAIHLCACGCGEKTVTPFTGINSWELTDGTNGVTLRPSIGNQNFPCHSHYWITNGEVQPC
jgi:hypothetical protein